ncbi:type II and III secretion system protein [Rhizobium laguerreae]|uniref:type II secretion system protein GspD n=1 Tax=Rhizobium laguerreae TaxID=1076926 RepID=UPI001C9112B6|nr:type II and III secretion system protein [Rhizobium laguerreae]MBY3150951.1 type II and III secretion system protein [Rhizobium laguerreae]MBY3433134.1 type II and III secretion system protein [Rhizobium laguerreae]
MTRTTFYSRFRKTTRKALLAALGSTVFLTSCASQLPKAKELPDIRQAQAAAIAKFTEDATVPIERIVVPASSMKAVTDRPPIPAHIERMPIDLLFPSNHESTLAGLSQALSSVGLQVTFQWSNPTQEDSILQKKLPFLSFQGTVGELLSALKNGLGLVAWYQDGMIYLSDQQRYSLSLPQNKDVLESVSKEIEELGAQNIVTSLRGGKIMYTASPSTQDDLIGPFLDRMSRNLAVVNMQVAVVSLSLNDSSEVGFDWDAFKIAFDSTKDGISGTGSTGTGTDTSTGTGSSTGTGTSTGTDSDDGSVTGVPGTVISMVGKGLSLNRTSLGNVFGTYGALTIGSAVKFLSTFGHTNVTQHVSLKTLSGSEVTLQSGQEVPYVKGVSSTNTGGDNTVGSSDTDTVETGLKLTLNPLYDSDAQVVTVDVEVDLNQILSFVELKAGNDIGTLTQPLVQKQNMKDLVQVQAGKTVVIGGLQYDSDTTNGNEPTVVRNALEGTGKRFGSDSKQVQRNALFIILRPTVTVYDRER